MSALQVYKDRVAALGCVACGCPAQLHHPREGQGMAQRASDWLVIPLCPLHHSDWHQRRAEFRMMWKELQTEMDMLAQVLRELNS